MSVQVADPKIYADIAKKLQSTEHADFCSCEVMTDEEVKDFIRKLCILNELTYNAVYHEEDDATDLYRWITPTKRPLIGHAQMLKRLEYIDYNITNNEIRLNDKLQVPEYAEKTMEQLQQIIETMKKKIPETNAHYKKALWSNID